MTKYWIGTVSQEHVLRGVSGGFCQVCHGKAAPPNRMKRGDWLLYYSPKIRMDDAEKLQAFTAFGQVTDDTAYPFQMSETFIPFRRNVEYAETRRNCPIDIVLTHPEWKKYASIRPSETFQTAAKAKHRTRKCSVFFNRAASLTPGTDLSEWAAGFRP